MLTVYMVQNCVKLLKYTQPKETIPYICSVVAMIVFWERETQNLQGVQMKREKCSKAVGQCKCLLQKPSENYSSSTYVM